MGFLYLGGLTIQEVGGIMMMGLSIYGVVVISRSLCSRFYGIYIYISNLVYNYIPIRGVCVVCDYISRMLVVQGNLINL